VRVVWPGDERDGCCDEEGGGPVAAVDIAGVGNGIEAFLDRFSCRTVGLEKMVLVQLGRSGYSCVVLGVDEMER